MYYDERSLYYSARWHELELTPKQAQNFQNRKKKTK